MRRERARAIRQDKFERGQTRRARPGPASAAASRSCAALSALGAPQRLLQLVGGTIADPRPHIIIKGARFDRARDSLVAEEAEEPRRQRDEVRLDESQIRVLRGEERVHEERGLVVEDLVLGVLYNTLRSFSKLRSCGPDEFGPTRRPCP